MKTENRKPKTENRKPNIFQVPHTTLLHCFTASSFKKQTSIECPLGPFIAFSLVLLLFIIYIIRGRLRRARRSCGVRGRGGAFARCLGAACPAWLASCCRPSCLGVLDHLFCCSAVSLLCSSGCSVLAVGLIFPFLPQRSSLSVSVGVCSTSMFHRFLNTIKFTTTISPN